MRFKFYGFGVDCFIRIWGFISKIRFGVWLCATVSSLNSWMYDSEDDGLEVRFLLFDLC